MQIIKGKDYWESVAFTEREKNKILLNELNTFKEQEYKIHRYDSLLKTFQQQLVVNVQLQKDCLEKDRVNHSLQQRLTAK